MYNFKRVNYSVRGSYLSWDACEDGIQLSTIRGWAGGVDEIFRIRYETEPEVSFTPWEMTVKTEKGQQNMCLFGMDNLYIKGVGEKITLEYCEYPNEYIANYVIVQDGKVYLNEYHHHSFAWIVPIRGSLEVEAPRQTGAIKSDYIYIHILPDEQGEYEIAIERFPSPSGLLTYMDNPYADCVEKLKQDYLAWEKKLRCTTEAEKEAAYVLWSNIVAPSGNFSAEAVIMSKAGMSAVWSWDNCINALALSDRDFRMALDQFMLPYQHMDKYGCLPDDICDSVIRRGYVKPPIQGWIYQQMMKRNPMFARMDVLENVYFAVKKNTEWWLNCRGETPFYTHGNDSGADNATCFDESEHIETPELLAFLSVQCAFLADTAEKFNLHTDKRVYRMLSEELAQKAVSDYWDGRVFVRDAITKQPYYSDSLMPLRMLVLGDKLPKAVSEHILHTVKTRHIANNGIASEALDSPHFDADGYWRGAVWAPDQVIFITTLREMGETALADEIAKQYQKALEENGFNENINALTGGGLRCKSYTWTASAYLIV